MQEKIEKIDSLTDVRNPKRKKMADCNTIQGLFYDWILFPTSLFQLQLRAGGSPWEVGH